MYKDPKTGKLTKDPHYLVSKFDTLPIFLIVSYFDGGQDIDKGKQEIQKKLKEAQDQFKEEENATTIGDCVCNQSKSQVGFVEHDTSLQMYTKKYVFS